MGNRLNIVVKTLVTVMVKKKLACKLSSYANCDKIECRCDDYDGDLIFPGSGCVKRIIAARSNVLR